MPFNIIVTIDDVKKVFRTILAILSFEDYSFTMNYNVIDLTIEPDPLNVRLDVTLEEWKLGCSAAYDYLLMNKNILTRFTHIFVPGTIVDTHVYSRIIFLVFKVIYYDRVGLETFLSLREFFQGRNKRKVNRVGGTNATPVRSKYKHIKEIFVWYRNKHAHDIH
jgi:hypothetical protein